MSGDPYRTATPVASRERIEADEAIAGHDGALGPLAPLFLPKALRARIGDLRTKDDDAAKIELAEALAEAVAFVTTREQELGALPTEHWSPKPLDDQWGPVGVELSAPAMMAEMKELVAELDPNVEITRLGPRVLARFQAGSVPIVWAVDFSGDLRVRTGTQHVLFTSSHHTMGALVSDDTPKLKIRREGITDVALKAVHLRSEVEIGDKAFDGEFFVEGHVDFAKAILGEPLRDALHERAKFSDFAFWLEGSVVELTWTGSMMFGGLTTPNAFPSSVDTIVATRDALGGLRLIRRGA